MDPFKNIKTPSRWLMHIIAWAIVFLLPYIFTSEYHDKRSFFGPNDSAFIYLDTATKIFWVLLFYLNAEILIPRFLYKKQYFLFSALQVLLFFVIMIIHGFFFELMISGRTFNFFRSSSYNIVAFLFTITVSIAYKTFSDRAKTDKAADEKQKENLKTELSFLRSQISPHFLFNVLNNMVALARMKSEELEPTIVKLSALMQYMLYETDEEKVLLKSEVEYLQSYIDLQKQRFSNKLKLDVLFDVKEDWHTIEPMLLIPFVENAFKHGIGSVQGPIIEIFLKTGHNQLEFTVKNKYKSIDAIKDKTSGIGLANVKRRLELLYGNNHQLAIDKTADWFSVSLKLAFKS